MKTTESSGPYTLFMLILSVVAIAALAISTLIRLDPGSRIILGYADTAICVIFFLDFLISLYRAPRRLSYFLRWGWIDLLSSIPMVDALRWGRAARILRILRILRGVRSAKVLVSFILEKRTESTFLAAGLLSIILIVMSSITILQFESDHGANITTPEDAVWWSIVTITTVGYGDRYPVSTPGRIIASVMMISGVGLFGILSGFVASWFVHPKQQTHQSELERILEEMRRLRELVETQTLAPASTPSPPGEEKGA